MGLLLTPLLQTSHPLVLQIGAKKKKIDALLIFFFHFSLSFACKNNFKN